MNGMSMVEPFGRILRLQDQGSAAGICSVCSANPEVVTAALEHARAHHTYALIEATANQVNQYGGYTGLDPEGFARLVSTCNEAVGLNPSRIVLGGDHLGPLVWSSEPAEDAMRKAVELVRLYVRAGFGKIHLDVSMPLGDEGVSGPPALELIASRTARLCAEAEREALDPRKAGNHGGPVYVIGSEVPPPGGARGGEEHTIVTDARDCEQMIDAMERAFSAAGLHAAWERVCAVVVQPGVEFGESSVHEYRREAAGELRELIRRYPNLVYEGHSTDYQRPVHLRQLAQDGVAILKVGPALTFALREALFALTQMEAELDQIRPFDRRSRFDEVLDYAMVANPVHWRTHYTGDAATLRFLRRYSLSDRCRYYLADPAVKEAAGLLCSNLRERGIPHALLSQFMPEQYRRVRESLVSPEPQALIRDRIRGVLGDYQAAFEGA